MGGGGAASAALLSEQSHNGLPPRDSVGAALRGAGAEYWISKVVGAVINGGITFGIVCATSLPNGDVDGSKLLLTPGAINLICLLAAMFGLEQLQMNHAKGNLWERPIADRAFEVSPWSCFRSFHQTSRWARCWCLFVELLIPYFVLLTIALLITGGSDGLSGQYSPKGAAGVFAVVNVIVSYTATTFGHLAQVKVSNLYAWQGDKVDSCCPFASVVPYNLQQEENPNKPQQVRECVTPSGMLQQPCIVLGPIVGLIGVLIPIVMPHVIHNIVKDRVKIKDESAQLYNVWKDPGGQTQISYEAWAWNVTNHEAYIYKGETPIVQRVGPFIYRQTNYKIPGNPQWIDGGHKLNFTYMTQYTFVPEQSFMGEEGLKLNVTLPNYFLQGIANSLPSLCDPAPPGQAPNCGVKSFQAQLVKNMMSGKLAGGEAYVETLFVKKTVQEVLFGWDHPVMNVINTGPTAPPGPPRPSFQALQRTGISQGMDCPPHGNHECTMWSGTSDPSLSTTFTKWNGWTEMPYWCRGNCPWSAGGGLPDCDPDPDCDANTHFGTDGVLVGPYHSRDDPLYIFTDTMSRQTPYIFEKKVDYLGLDLDRYVYDMDQTMNDTKNQIAYGHFGPEGVWNLTSAYSASIIIAKQNFLDADPVYRQRVTLQDTDGSVIVPDRARDDSYRAVEKHLGVVIDAMVRMQTGLLFNSDPDNLGFFAPENATKFPTAVIPMLTTSTGGGAPKSQVDLIKGVNDQMDMINQLCPMGIMLGILLFVWGKLMKRRGKRALNAEKWQRAMMPEYLRAYYDDENTKDDGAKNVRNYP